MLENNVYRQVLDHLYGILPEDQIEWSRMDQILTPRGDRTLNLLGPKSELEQAGLLTVELKAKLIRNMIRAFQNRIWGERPNQTMMKALILLFLRRILPRCVACSDFREEFIGAFIQPIRLNPSEQDVLKIRGRLGIGAAFNTLSRFFTPQDSFLI